VLAELAAHLEDDRAGRAGHGVDGQAGEEEDDGRTEHDSDEGVRVGDQAVGAVEEVLALGLLDPRDVERTNRALPGVGVGAEQCGGREDGRGDRDALGDGLGGVAHGVELGEDLGALPSTSPDISAMPWALSETGPKVSIATMTPTVVSRPQPARR
jgi:hypothetical protein